MKDESPWRVAGAPWSVTAWRWLIRSPPRPAPDTRVIGVAHPESLEAARALRTDRRLSFLRRPAKDEAFQRAGVPSTVHSEAARRIAPRKLFRRSPAHAARTPEGVVGELGIASIPLVREDGKNAGRASAFLVPAGNTPDAEESSEPDRLGTVAS